ncbi:histone-lysine N-methyltransferase SETMAR [Trichonephila clavipes]|nr:histone-lysine N-methyltransferase SETMAR [Trichonephila clavipes]
MSVDKVHFRYCILHEFQKGSNASVGCKNLCAVFEKDIVNVRTCQRWFSKFRSGDLSLRESDRSGRPSKIDNDVLRSMLENNPHLTSQEIAEEFGIHHTQLLKITLNLVDTMWSRFLDKLITGDEKWILYENIKGKKSYCKPGTSSATAPKPSIHQRKELLCLLWDRKDPVYYELLKQGKTINADLYCNQLDKLNASIKEKRPALASRKGIVYHHDNPRLLTAMVTQQKLDGKSLVTHRIHLNSNIFFKIRQNFPSNSILKAKGVAEVKYDDDFASKTGVVVILHLSMVLLIFTLDRRAKQSVLQAMTKRVLFQHQQEPVVRLRDSSYTRACGDGPRNFEPWSSDVDDT